jgi:hypothetical protein
LFKGHQLKFQIKGIDVISLPGRSQVYYYNKNTLGPLISGELGSSLQSYVTVSYTSSSPSVPQPEMVMVLKEVQPTNILTPVSTSGIFHSVATELITESTFQGELKRQKGVKNDYHSVSNPQISGGYSADR